jgi:cytochrome oxidase Cu insertion factor (SCO1/SenC/PrrC family)
MLKEKLDEISCKMGEQLPQEILAKLGEGLKELQDTHIEEKTIKAGEKLPDFTLVDTAGKKYTRETFKDKKMVFNFFRGSW